MICEVFDTVVVPFPFSDRLATKRRPALVVSQRGFNRHGHSILAMVTSVADRPWPGDAAVNDLPAAGLPKLCVVRLKLFTLDNRLILRKIGHLSGADRKAVRSSAGAALGLADSI